MKFFRRKSGTKTANNQNVADSKKEPLIQTSTAAKAALASSAPASSAPAASAPAASALAASAPAASAPAEAAIAKPDAPAVGDGKMPAAVASGSADAGAAAAAVSAEAPASPTAQESVEMGTATATSAVNDNTQGNNDATAAAPSADEIPTKIPNSKGKAAAGALASTPGFLFYGAAAALVLGGTIYAIGSGGNKIPSTGKKDLEVAFMGGSYFVINDIPRLLEALSGGHITQNSCLHASGSLAMIASTGNGMYSRWQTSEAAIESFYENGEYYTLYDYGYCTVKQLLAGYDDNLTYTNYNGEYTDDGENPCIQDQVYLDYLNSANDTNDWDFVVLSDSAKRMAFQEARDEVLEVMETDYVPLLQETDAIPVVVAANAFWASNSNMTGLENVPTFTSLVQRGAVQYAEYLEDNLDSSQKPRVARVGLAFLTVWEEDSDMWAKLFLDNEIYASPYGSFLIACVLYATMYGRMPSDNDAIPDEISELFAHGRKVMAGNGYPSVEEADYLFNVARRVVLKNYEPESFIYMDGTY